MLKIELEVVAATKALMADALILIAKQLRGGDVRGEFNPCAVKWEWVLDEGDYLSSEKEKNEE